MAPATSAISTISSLYFVKRWNSKEFRLRAPHVEHPQWLDVRVLWRSRMVTADLRRTDDLAERHDGDEKGFAAFLPEGAVRVRPADAAFGSRLHPFLERCGKKA
jgi:hypothetical protein